MKVAIDTELLDKAGTITGISDKNILVEKALHLLISIESQENPPGFLKADILK